MLSSDARLRTASDWTEMRRAASASRATVVVRVGSLGGDRRAAGFIVSRAIGGAVVRNSVKRRLRAILRDVLPDLPPGTGIVVRALPPAAHATFNSMAEDVREAVLSALRKRQV